MTYTKPNVAILGDATRVIESQNKSVRIVDNPSQLSDPAYDLDE